MGVTWTVGGRSNDSEVIAGDVGIVRIRSTSVILTSTAVGVGIGMGICVDGACDNNGCIVVCPGCGSFFIFASGCLVVAGDVGIGSTFVISSTAVGVGIGMGICVDGACDNSGCSGIVVCPGCGSFFIFARGCLVVAGDVGIGSTFAISSTAVGVGIGMGICVDGACDNSGCSSIVVCPGYGSFFIFESGCLVVAGVVGMVGTGSICAISTSTAVGVGISMGICVDGACGCSGVTGCGSSRSSCIVDTDASTWGLTEAGGVIDFGGVGSDSRTTTWARSWATGVVSGVGIVVT